MKKRISILMVLTMIINFFAPNFMVNATNENEVQKKIASIETMITNTNSLIDEIKLENDYIVDNSVKVSTDYFTNTFNLEVELFNIIKNNLNDIKISDLVDLDSTKEENYNKYLSMSNLDQTIDISNINDITFNYIYIDPVLGEQNQNITLFTKGEIENLIINNYLDDIYDSISNFNNTKLTSLKNEYISLVGNIENEIDILNNYKSLVEDYEEDEKALNNNPNMIINNNNIYTLFDNYNTSLNSLKTEIDLSNNTYINDSINNLHDEIEDIYDEFVTNNSDFSLLETMINDLNTNYSNEELLLNNYLESKSLNLEDINLINLDSNIITMTNNLKDLKDDYDDLINLVNKYLERRPSDNTLSSSKLSILDTHINTYDFTNLNELVNGELEEDKVDLLLDSKWINSVNKEILEDIKLSFYDIGLKDDSVYSIILKNNTMVVDKLLSLNINDLYNNIKYDYNFSILSENNNNYILFKDKNDNDLVKYQVLLKNDLDNDYILTNEDVDLLKNKLNNNLDEEELLLSDFNNDEVLNIKDITDLDNYINNLYLDSNNNDSKFITLKEENDNKVIYSIYLDTDGLMGFEFNINISSDLIFDSYETNQDLIIDNINNPSKISSNSIYGEKTLLIKLTYLIDKDSTKSTFNLNNGLIVLNNGQTISDLSNIDIITRELKIDNKVTINNSNDEDTDEEVEEITSLDSNDITIEEEDDSKDKLVSEEIEEDSVDKGNVVKVILVVLLGSAIIYLLSKSDDDSEDKKDFLKTKESKK